MTRLLAVNGSYLENGAIDQAVEVAAQAAEAAGATIEVVTLREFPLEACADCHRCSRTPGEIPDDCLLKDLMRTLIEKVNVADGFILASPTNFYTTTAVFKRFMERVAAYSCWRWGVRNPGFGKQGAAKSAVLIASSAAPGLTGRLFFTTLNQLRQAAKCIGARPAGSVFIGMTSWQADPVLEDKTREQLRSLVEALARSC